jgi:hypothetical protein
MKPTVLSLCDESGNMVRPWVEAGHKAVLVDKLHTGVTTEGNITRVGADVRDYLNWLEAHPYVRFGIVFAFPPCTDLAVSGARHFANKGAQARFEALDVVYTCMKVGEQQDCPYMIENPVSVISSEWRKPDFYWDPDWYAGWNPDNHWADAYTKKTCLWVGNGFRTPGPDVRERKNPSGIATVLRWQFQRPVPSTQGSKMHRLPPGPNRARVRSITPLGFAYAVYEANKGLV